MSAHVNEMIKKKVPVKELLLKRGLFVRKGGWVLIGYCGIEINDQLNKGQHP